MRSRWAVVLFIVLFVTLTAWVAASDGDHAAIVRHALRGMLRALF